MWPLQLLWVEQLLLAALLLSWRPHPVAAVASKPLLSMSAANYLLTLQI
jgi:hypothetical protein